MTGPAAPRVAPGSGSSSRSPRGARIGAAQREAHHSLRAPTPPSSRTRVPRFPTTGAQMTQSAFKPPPLPLPPRGRDSRLPRGGVGIKRLRSRRRGKSSTGPKLKDLNLKPQAPASSLLLSLPLGSRTSTLLLGSLARGQGARAPPPPRTQTAVPRDVAALNFANYSARTLTSGAARTCRLGVVGGV